MKSVPNAPQYRLTAWAVGLLIILTSNVLFLYRDVFVVSQQIFFRRPRLSRPLFHFENATEQVVLRGYASNPTLFPYLLNVSSVLIDDYMAWHRGVLDRINAGEENVSQLRVLVHWSDKGTGDRFRGLLNAYLCAVFSERFFLLKWEEPFPLSTVFDVGIRTNFTYDADKYGGRDYPIPTKDFKVPIEAFTRLLDDTPLKMMCNWDLNSLRLFMHNIPHFHPNLTTSEKMIALGERRQGLQREWLFRLLLQALFRPTDRFVTHLSRYVAGVVPTARSGEGLSIDALKPYIGVHVRLGNDTKELHYWRFRHQMPVRETARCLAARMIKESQKRHVDPPRFFLATDATALRPVLLTELHRLDRRAVLHTGDWTVKHIKHMNDTSDDLASYLNMFVEIYMLSHSEALVNSNSAFNDLADWWGNISARTRFEIDQCRQNV